MESVNVQNLYLDRLPAMTRRAFLSFAEADFLKNSKWYLAGGTAFALQVGHRQSVDLDFFSSQSQYNETLLERKLLETKQWVTTLKEEGTLYGTLEDAKASFIAYPFFQPAEAMIRVGNLRILHERDIAVMKIIAISQRGRKRDFVDMYWYATRKEPLVEIIPRVSAQYPGREHNVPHFIKSLVYFEDAEGDPMPKIFFDADWKKIKAYFRREVPKVAKELLGLN